MGELNLYLHWRGLTKAQRKSFAKAAGTSVGYIENHLIHRRKTPQSALIRRLTLACRKTGLKDAQDASLALWFFNSSPAVSAVKAVTALKKAPPKKATVVGG